MLPRFIQTTIAVQRPDHAMSAIFVPTLKLADPQTLAPSLRDLLGIQDATALPPQLDPSEPFQYIDQSWLANKFFGTTDSDELDVLWILLNDDTIVVEHSPPIFASLASFLKGASGVAIGAYVGIATGIPNPMLMFVTVPFGIIIVGAASGVGHALEQGLRDMILRLLGAVPGSTTSSGGA